MTNWRVWLCNFAWLVDKCKNCRTEVYGDC